MSSFSALWHAKHKPPADPAHLSFNDQTVLVTGANSGLGHEAAVKYAAHGASHLILAVRTTEKGEQAKADIIRRTACSPSIFTILTLDLSTFASVKQFIGDLNAAAPDGVHVAQLAAGIATWGFEKSAEGYEMSVQVNLLSTTLLGLLLLPIMQKTARGEGGDAFVPHMSFVHSIASMEVTQQEVSAFGGQSLIQRINDEGKFDNQRQYFLVKLASWFAIQGLVEKNRKEAELGKRIVINASDPGLCKTGMLKGFPGFVRAIMAVKFWLVGRSVEEGARTLVSATGLGVESDGRFWRNDGFSELSELLESETGEELAKKSWEEIMGILKSWV